MNIIFIRKLKVPTIIGIYPWERQVKQSLFIDADIKVNDITKSALKDNIIYTISYEDISKEISQFIENNSFKLIETLAHYLAEHLLKKFNILSIQLKIGKQNTLISCQEVGIIIQRDQIVK